MEAEPRHLQLAGAITPKLGSNTVHKRGTHAMKNATVKKP
jgi:hypothetical protein